MNDYYFNNGAITGLRTGLDMTQRSFGDQLGVPQVTVYRWEAGLSKPNADHIARMYDLAHHQGPGLEFKPFNKI